MRWLYRFGCACILSFGTLSLGTLSLGTACAPAVSVTTELQIGGMVCASCSEALTFALAKVEGVDHVTVDHVSGRAVIHHAARVQRETLVQVVTGLGYTVAP